MNPKALAEAEEAAAQLPNIRSFLVVWKGDVVSENTYGGTTAETLHDLRSVTKSIISALVGIAIDRGIIRAVDDCVLDYLPELRSRADDERKAQITIEHLLTMTSGFRSAETWEWYFSDAPHAILDAWDRPMAANPGDTYAYESASMELLSVALARAADQDTKSFAVENLLAPLGITGFQWEQDPAGKSYALLLAAQGYRCDAKAGMLGFDPKVTPQYHRSFFCTKSAWGTFAQQRRDKAQANTLSVKYGNLSLKELQLALPQADLKPELLVSIRLESVSAKLLIDGSRARIVFPKPMALAAGDYLIAQFSW